MLHTSTPGPAATSKKVTLMWAQTPKALSLLATTASLAVVSGASSSTGVTSSAAPARTRIAFSSDRTLDGTSIHGDRIPNFDIYVVNADGRAQRRLTRFTGVDDSPTWSPDGHRIAYASEDLDETSEIVVMEADGSHRRYLTDDYGRAPNWSPDGRKIVYEYLGPDLSPGGQSTIRVMDSDGRGDKQLTHGLYDYSPSWSPDGRKIVFSCGIKGDQVICVMNADGSGRQVLVRTRGFATDPAWSPNGRTIAFSNKRNDASDIYVVDTGGGTQRRLTTDGRSGDPPGHPTANGSPKQVAARVTAMCTSCTPTERVSGD
jgi:Tol biopolymer transport system component